jgi:hypothetical protein
MAAVAEDEELSVGLAGDGQRLPQGGVPRRERVRTVCVLAVVVAAQAAWVAGFAYAAYRFL